MASEGNFSVLVLGGGYCSVLVFGGGNFSVLVFGGGYFSVLVLGGGYCSVLVLGGGYCSVLVFGGGNFSESGRKNEISMKFMLQTVQILLFIRGLLEFWNKTHLCSCWEVGTFQC